MNIAAIQTLYRYHYHRLQEIWDAIATLSEAQFFQPIPYSVGSLYNQMVHVIDDDLKWFSLLRGDGGFAIADKQLTTRKHVRERFDHIQAAILSFIDSLDETILSQEFVWQTATAAQTVTGWQVLLHVNPPVLLGTNTNYAEDDLA